jgi:PPP family 3-phenylpropionic acid transporter
MRDKLSGSCCRRYLNERSHLPRIVFEFMQPIDPIAIARRRFAVRLSVFYAATFAILGAYTPFFPLWLKAKGLDATWIGIVIAMPTIARLTAVPAVTRLAERRQAIVPAILITSALATAGFGLLAAMPGALAIALMQLVIACAWTPTLPLTDAYALRGVAAYEVSYGPIRLWGSVAYIAGVLAAGLVAAAVAPVHLIWVVVAITALSAVSAATLQPVPTAPRPLAAKFASPGLLRDRGFVAVLAAAALIQGSHAAYYSFSSIAWQAQGFSSTTISVLWSLCVVAEIVLFAWSPRVGFAPSTFLILGGAAAALRWTVTAFEPPLAVLGAVQLLHAFTFGATHLGVMGLLAHRVPGHSLATAQGTLTASVGLVSATATILCGRLFNTYGESIYFGMAAMAAAGALVMLTMRGAVEKGSVG